MSKKIGIIVGSLRKESFNRKVAETLVSLAPASLQFEWIAISNLPLYNEDSEGEHTPAAWTQFRNQVKACDGILFATPEYNRSVPAALKNAIDVGSRPYGQNVWGKKPAAIISVSPGTIGGFGANHHLRQSLMCLDMPCLQQPEAYLGGIHNLIDKNTGKITNEGTLKFLKDFITAYAAWMEK